MRINPRYQVLLENADDIGVSATEFIRAVWGFPADAHEDVIWGDRDRNPIFRRQLAKILGLSPTYMAKLGARCQLLRQEHRRMLWFAMQVVR